MRMATPVRGADAWLRVASRRSSSSRTMRKHSPSRGRGKLKVERSSRRDRLDDYAMPARGKSSCLSDKRG